MKFTWLSIVFVSLLWTGHPPLDWELKKNKEGIQVFIKKIPGSPLHAFKGTMELASNLDDIQALFEDIEGYTEWSPNAKFVKPLEKAGNKRIFYLQTNAPWPVTDRDGIYQFEFTKTAQQLTIRSTCLPDYLPVKKDHIRVPKSEGSWQFTVQEQGKLQVIYQNHSDPGGSIPGWLANSAVVNLPFESLKNLRQMVQN